MEQREILSVQIRRYPAEDQADASLVTYQVPYVEGMSIMDALRYIQEHIDSTLAFDCSCRIGICKACAVRVDGEVMMACSTAARDGMCIEPVNVTGVQRDLIVRPGRLAKSLSDVLAEANRSAGE